MRGYSTSETKLMRTALSLARRAFGKTSPNPAVGAVLMKEGSVIGAGYTQPAGQAHAEIQALLDAKKRGNDPKGATLYVTLEPCCTHGRTPPCTDAIKAAGIKNVVVGATDPNPAHAGKAFRLLANAGIQVKHGLLAREASLLNEAFNHWIVHRTPFVTVKAAMTLDAKIATSTGESKWITGEKARAYGMKLRQGADAILVGVNTVLADDPNLTLRGVKAHKAETNKLRRIILDSQARTPLKAKVTSDAFCELTTVVVSKAALERRVKALARQVNVLVAPEKQGKIDLRWLLKRLGGENVTNLLVEGGGEVNASFLLGGLAHRVAFFYAPKVLGGRDARKGVAGDGVESLTDAIKLNDVEWRKLGADLLLTARVNGD
jgi:diaminohydroxyphosphoribosylaminopyrimidine deaminase / 5-amino-6-(5-phosphoribosylamino)uracil reductase